MPNHSIVITSADETTHKLKLRLDREDGTSVDGKEITVERFDTVTWSIETVNVASFVIKKKPHSKPIFISFDPPQSHPAKQVIGWVHPLAPRGREYDYSIIWNSTSGGPPHPYDPKITIDPIKKDFLSVPIVAFIAGIVTFFSVFLLLKGKKKN